MPVTLARLCTAAAQGCCKIGYCKRTGTLCLKAHNHHITIACIADTSSRHVYVPALQLLRCVSCRIRADGRMTSTASLPDRVTVHLLLARTLMQSHKFPEATKVHTAPLQWVRTLLVASTSMCHTACQTGRSGFWFSLADAPQLSCLSSTPC